ncbi:hypothetical protein V8F33_004364 [Rhypophila sp. PSN 637]
MISQCGRRLWFAFPFPTLSAVGGPGIAVSASHYRTRQTRQSLLSLRMTGPLGEHSWLIFTCSCVQAESRYCI